eukprot:2238576-Rhodomonas_salina.1
MVLCDARYEPNRQSPCSLPGCSGRPRGRGAARVDQARPQGARAPIFGCAASKNGGAASIVGCMCLRSRMYCLQKGRR